MEDKDIRLRICWMLKLDRCMEEQRRLGIEADNFWHWYGEELAAIELALHIPESMSIQLAFPSFMLTATR
jgi:hypothetical protein